MVRQCSIASRYVYMLSYSTISSASNAPQAHVHAHPQRLFLHKRTPMQSSNKPSNQFLPPPNPRSTNMCVGVPNHTNALFEHIALRKAQYRQAALHARTAPWRAVSSVVSSACMRKLSGARHDAFVACVTSERLSCLKCVPPGECACVFACLAMAPYVHKSSKYGGTLHAFTCRCTGSLRAELCSTILESRASAHYDSHLVSQRGRIRSP